MNILVIMGSPRKGETFQAVQKVEAQMKSLGDVTFEYLWLKDVNLGQCRGCHACIRFGENKCPMKTDRAAIEARMMAADGVIFATPVYSNQVSYLMKTYIDLLTYLWHRPRYFGKFAMGVASGGGMFKNTLGYIKENTTNWGFTYASEVGAPHMNALVPKERAKLERNIEKAARKFYETIRSKKVAKPGIADLLRFRMWRINAIACKSDNPTDFRHWTENGWFERDYYDGQTVNPFTRWFTLGMEKALRAFLRGVYVGY